MTRILADETTNAKAGSFMQQPPLDFLPQADDPAQLSATERDRILWTAAKRYMQGLITEDQYKDIERRYRKTIPPRRVKNG